MPYPDELRTAESVARDQRDPLPRKKDQPVVIHKPIYVPGPDADQRDLNET